MTLTSANVRVAVTGLVAVGPTTADAPTSTESALDSDFTDLGYISDAGLTESRTRTVEDIKAWQNAAVVRSVVTESKITFKFSCIETNPGVLETFYAAATAGATATDGRLDVDPSATGGRQSWIFDVIDDDEALRIYVAEGEMTELGDVVYASGAAIGREVTVTGYPVAGVAAKIWSTALAT